MFADDENPGIPIIFKPETGTLRLGDTESPFSVATLPKGEDVEICIFVDKYLIEVFVNKRQAMIATHMDWQNAKGLRAYSFGASTSIKEVTTWPLNATNGGYLEAQRNPIWEPDTK